MDVIGLCGNVVRMEPGYCEVGVVMDGNGIETDSKGDNLGAHGCSRDGIEHYGDGAGMVLRLQGDGIGMLDFMRMG